MSSSEVPSLSTPAPTARSPLHAPYDKAEPASPPFLQNNINSWSSAASSATYVDRESLASPKKKGPFQFAIQVGWSRFAEYFTLKFKELYRHYQLHRQEQRSIKLWLAKLYEDFKEESIDKYPPGFPQLAAFLHCEDNFAIFRRFGLAHCRVLVHLQAEIHLLEQELAALDKSDAIPDSPTYWRLHTAQHQEGWDSAQRDLLKQLQDKLITYDTLLFNDQRLRDLGRPVQTNYLSVFHWIKGNKPLCQGQYDWIFYKDDFIPQSTVPRFESSILSSFCKIFFLTPNHNSSPGRNSLLIDHYSLKVLSTISKLLTVTLAVGILIIPVFILLWAPLSRIGISATVLVSVLSFSSLMSLYTKAPIKEVLVGTAAYCAVLATFLGNTPGMGKGSNGK